MILLRARGKYSRISQKSVIRPGFFRHFYDVIDQSRARCHKRHRRTDSSFADDAAGKCWESDAFDHDAVGVVRRRWWRGST
jgi:hypothetical protein